MVVVCSIDIVCVVVICWRNRGYDAALNGLSAAMLLAL
jgi:hypothetical protein